MELLKKALSELVLNPVSMTMIVGGIVFLVVRRWRHFQLHRKARDEQVVALSPLAAGSAAR